MRSLLACFVVLYSVSALAGCVMSEEIKRIESKNKAARERDASSSTNLNGEQLFVRSCNTCHPSGKAGMGPSLENMATKFPEDAALKAFIRKGKGVMPAQTPDRMDDGELESLVGYLRTLDFSK